jgi:hypothetical protein
VDFFLRKFSLENIDDFFFGSISDFFSKLNDLIFDIDESFDVFSNFGNSHGVSSNDFPADSFDFDVRFGSYFINEVSDG